MGGSTSRISVARYLEFSNESKCQGDLLGSDSCLNDSDSEHLPLGPTPSQPNQVIAKGENERQHLEYNIHKPDESMWQSQYKLLLKMKGILHTYIHTYKTSTYNVHICDSIEFACITSLVPRPLRRGSRPHLSPKTRRKNLGRHGNGSIDGFRVNMFHHCQLFYVYYMP